MHLRAYHTIVRAVATAAIAIAPAAAAAQEDAPSRRPALVIGGQSTVGVSIPVTKRMSLRPDLSLTYSTFNSPGMESSLLNLGLGVGVILHLRDLEGVTTYLAPRIAVTRAIPDVGSSSDLWLADVALGLSAPLAKRLALFAELGPRYSYAERTNPLAAARTASISARSVMGATFSF